MIDQSISPTPEQVRKAREKAGLTQQQAAELVYRNSLQRWSEWETNLQPMPPAEWELFLFKTRQHPNQ